VAYPPLTVALLKANTERARLWNNYIP